MYKCNSCNWCYDEPGAGLLQTCGCEELTEEEYDRFRNRGEGDCPYWVGNEDLDGEVEDVSV